jgi:hypothetical protein
VTRTVSPDAASRMYSLSRLLSVLIPTDRMVDKVATGRYLVNPISWCDRQETGSPYFIFRVFFIAGVYFR